MAEYNEATQTPIVSVILPTYNRVRYLEQAVQSVLVQSFKEFELIIVDDGSIDNTHELVSNFNDDRVRYEYQANSGRSSARNHGLSKARGKYISFIDDDDLYFPDKLETQVSFLERCPEFDLVAGGVILIDGDGNRLHNWPVWYDTPNFDILTCVSNCRLFPTIVLVRHHAIKSNNIWFDRLTEPNEDTDFFVQLALAGCAMSWDKRYIASYRLHEGSSQHNAIRYKQARLRMLEKIYQRDKVPQPLLDNRDNLFASVYLTSACHNILLGEDKLAAEDYVYALDIDPNLTKGNPPIALERVAAFAYSIHVENQRSFLEKFWGNLPEGVGYSLLQRYQTLSMIYIYKVFRAHSNPDQYRFSWNDWLHGVAYDPRWLFNRGIWSIFFQYITTVLGLKRKV